MGVDPASRKGQTRVRSCLGLGWGVPSVPALQVKVLRGLQTLRNAFKLLSANRQFVTTLEEEKDPDGSCLSLSLPPSLPPSLSILFSFRNVIHTPVIVCAAGTRCSLSIMPHEHHSPRVRCRPEQYAPSWRLIWVEQVGNKPGRVCSSRISPGVTSPRSAARWQ